MSPTSTESAYQREVAYEPLAESVGHLVGGVWLPKEDEHLLKMTADPRYRHEVLGVNTYQWKKQALTYAYVKEDPRSEHNWTFIDVGAHVGLWSMWWDRWATTVVAFEPVPVLRSLFRRNVPAAHQLHPVALGAREGNVTLSYNPGNTGNTHVSAGPSVAGFSARLTTLDRVYTEFGAEWDAPLAMKIDCEGYEEEVVKGALNLIRKHRPVICVEQKANIQRYPGAHLGAVKLLVSEGYSVAREVGGDYIMRYKTGDE